MAIVLKVHNLGHPNIQYIQRVSWLETFFCLYIASIHSVQCKYYLDLRYLHPSIQKLPQGGFQSLEKKSGNLNEIDIFL